MARVGRKARSYSRRPAKREPGACLRIVMCKPGAIELDGYLQELIHGTFDLKTQLIEIQDIDSKTFNGSICSLIKSVAVQKEDNEARYKRDSERVVKVDEWWVVADAGFGLDHDQMDVNSAITLANESGIRLLIDDPSFEYWALLHACYTTQRYDDAGKLLNVLEEKLADTGIDFTPQGLLRRLGSALINSATLRAVAAQGIDCPHVNFDILVDRLAKYANWANKKALIIPSDRKDEDFATIVDGEPGRHASRLFWRGLRQRPAQVVPYELRLYDSVVATFDVSMDMDGKRSYEIVSVTDNSRLLPLPFAEDMTERGLKAWFETRTIPQGQGYAYDVLERAGVNVKDTFSQIELGFGLSLTDAYWVAPQGLGLTWSHVNLYESDIKDNLSMSIYDPKRRIEVPTGLIASVENNENYFNISPAYGVGGTFKKAWYKNDDVYILRKSGSERCSANTGQEPWSEFVASQVAEAMGIEHVAYGLEYYQGELVSTCKLLNSELKGLVPALAVIGDNGGDFFSTMAAFASLGDEALDAFRDMIIFDCLICNTDRHANNHGFIRDNATGMIQAIAPLFDHNYSLFPYDMPNDYEEWRTGERPYTYDACRPRLTDANRYMTFDEQAAYALGHNQRERLRRLLGPGVKLKNAEGRGAVPEERLEAWESFIAARANRLLSMKSVDDHDVQVILTSRSVTRKQLPGVRLGLIGKMPLRRAKPEY